MTDCEDLAKIFSNLDSIEPEFIASSMTNYCDWRFLILPEDELPVGFSRSKESRGFKGADRQHRNIDFEYHHIPIQLRQIYLGFLKDLVITPKISDFVEQFSSQHFDAQTISIHMRSWMTDSWDQAPKRHAHYFKLDRYKDLLEKNRDKSVFLSSDNYEFACELVNFYPDRIITCQLDSEFDTTEQAFVNVLLLAKNNHIIGSNISTFTEMAWWYGGCQASVEFV